MLELAIFVSQKLQLQLLSQVTASTFQRRFVQFINLQYMHAQHYIFHC